MEKVCEGSSPKASRTWRRAFQLGGRQMTFAEGGGQSSPSPVGLRTKCLKPGRGSPHQAGPQLSLPGLGWGAVFMSIWALPSWQGSRQGPTPLAQPHPAMELSLQPAGLAVGAGIPDQCLVRWGGGLLCAASSIIRKAGVLGPHCWGWKFALTELPVWQVTMCGVDVSQSNEFKIS